MGMGHAQYFKMSSFKFLTDYLRKLKNKKDNIYDEPVLNKILFIWLYYRNSENNDFTDFMG